MSRIQSLAQLRAIIDEPNSYVQHKLQRELTAQAREFIQRSPFFLLATADKDGAPSVSPKGDGPGFVHIEDATTLLIPERKGNRLLFSLQNILANPKVGLIFLLPGTNETLRITGVAELLDDTELNKRFTSRGQPALLVTRVHIEQCYFHCAKAFLRSEMWNPESWTRSMKISFGEEIALNTNTVVAEELDAQILVRYRQDL